MTSRAQQSPIDLRHTVSTKYPHTLRISWTEDVQGTIVRDDHGVKIVYGSDARQVLELDGKKYHLAEMHFHHPSDHWVDGMQQLIEVHIVSQNVHDGTRAALGVFIDVEQVSVEGRADEITRVLDHMERCEPGGSLAFITNPLAYLPGDVEHYYRYEGSLTTPDYAEDISWAVFRDAARFPRRQVDRMIRLFGDPPRLPQPLNRRFVLANFPS